MKYQDPKRIDLYHDAIALQLRKKDAFMANHPKETDLERPSVSLEPGSSASLDSGFDGHDRPPGVYVRSTAPDHDLDLLWPTHKHAIKDDRSPWFVFTLGIMAGAIIAVLSILALLNKPLFIDRAIHRIQVNGSENSGFPAIQIPKLKLGLPGPNNNNIFAGHTTSEKATDGAKKPGEKPVLAETQDQVYQVSAGDTLGGIALKYYGSTSPKDIERIQKANNMKSPNALKLGQDLKIPALHPNNDS
jgi:LysM repeat protein